jgi:hypothetical protein
VPNPRWRTSSYSADRAECIEVAELGEDTIGIRDSKDPDGPALRFSRASAAAWLRAHRRAELDPH